MSKYGALVADSAFEMEAFGEISGKNATALINAVDELSHTKARLEEAERLLANLVSAMDRSVFYIDGNKVLASLIHGVEDIHEQAQAFLTNQSTDKEC